MKKKLLLAVLLIPVTLWGTDSDTLIPDTTITYGKKQIVIDDGGQRMKIKVYNSDSYEGRPIEDEMIFEGHYKDGLSYEMRKQQRSITIPLPSWNRSFDPHWAGFGLGFANFADRDLHVNDIDGVSLNSERSWELYLNFIEHDFRLSRRYGWALVTGMGIRWNRYRLDGNEYFKRVDGVTRILPAPEGMRYTVSKLGFTSLTVPLLLEWQPGRRRHSDFFISAGIVGYVKTISSSKVVYRNERDKKRKEKKDEGLYIRPVNMDFMFQMGYNWIGLYVKYSPFELFEHQKGPRVHPVSMGFQLHL